MLDAAAASALATFNKLPMSFELNQGQRDSSVQFLTRGPGYELRLGSSGAELNLGSAGAGARATLRMTPVGGNQRAVPTTGKTVSRGNYFRGDDSSRWLTDIPVYDTVSYSDVYPGVDLVYHGGESKSELEYDFVVRPGASPDAIQLRFDGVDDIELDSSGNLVLHTAVADVVQHAPIIYQDAGGSRVAVPGHFVLADDHTVRFSVGDYDHAKPLVIDPILNFFTYAGNASAAIKAIGTGPGDDIVFVSTIPGSNQDVDSQVTRMSADGKEVIFQSVISGEKDDVATGLYVAFDGAIFVTGTTGSASFPKVNASIFQNTLTGSTDGFLLRMSFFGNGLAFSTYLSGTTRANAVSQDTYGNTYVTGLADTTGFVLKKPLVDSKQTPLGGSLFVMSVGPTGQSLGYATRAGAGEGVAIAADLTGDVVVAGISDGTGTPVILNPTQASYGGGKHDAIVLRINYRPRTSNDTPVLAFGTFLGGSGDDVPTDVALDPASAAFVTGYTESTNFPTGGTGGVSLQPNFGGVRDAFITKFTATGARSYSTYLGGSSSDEATGITIGHETTGVFITGVTQSSNFPTLNPIQAASGGNGDAFLTRTSRSGTLLFSSYLGGAQADRGTDVALDSSGYPLVAGLTSSPGLATPGVFQPSIPAGQSSAPFITKYLPSRFEFVDSAVSAVEGAGAVSLTIQRVGDPNVQGIAEFQTADGSATADNDYTQTNGRVIFAPGETSKTITIPILDNASISADRQFFVQLFDPTIGNLGASSQATVTIQNNDFPVGPGTLQFAGPAAIEVQETAGSISIIVRRVGGSTGSVSVPFTTTDGTASGDPNSYTPDYSATSGILTFGPGVIQQTITIPILNNSIHEPSQTFSVTLGAPSGGAILGTPATVAVTIVDDDPGGGAGTISVINAPVVVTEGQGVATITVLRAGGFVGAVSVPYTTVDASAVAPGDYTATSGTITFNAGEETKTITIPIANDTAVEDVEAFVFQLGAPTGGAQLGPASTIAVVIVDNDVALPPPVQVSAAAIVRQRRRQRPGVQLTFSGLLNGNQARNLSFYRVVQAGRDRKFGTGDDRTIRLFRSAFYTPGNGISTVRLNMRPRVVLKGQYRLFVKGTPPLTLTDSFGRAIDGNRDGQAGGDAQFILRQRGLRQI